jgi:hypothetical protein
MWHAWVRRVKCAGFGWESQKERDHLEGRGIDGRMGSEWIYGRLAGVGAVEWIHLVQDGDRWRVANAVMNLWGSSAMELIVITTPSQANVAVPHYYNSELPHHFSGL